MADFTGVDNGEVSDHARARLTVLAVVGAQARACLVVFVLLTVSIFAVARPPVSHMSAAGLLGPVLVKTPAC